MGATDLSRDKKGWRKEKARDPEGRAEHSRDRRQEHSRERRHEHPREHAQGRPRGRDGEHEREGFGPPRGRAGREHERDAREHGRGREQFGGREHGRGREQGFGGREQPGREHGPGGRPRDQAPQQRERPQGGRERARPQREQAGPPWLREKGGPRPHDGHESQPRERYGSQPRERQEPQQRERYEPSPRKRHDSQQRERREPQQRERQEPHSRGSGESRPRASAGERVARAYEDAAIGRVRRPPRVGPPVEPRDGFGVPEPEQDEPAHVFGVQPVLEALRAGSRPIERVSVAEGAHEARLQEIMALARAAEVPVRRVPRAALQLLVGGANHQGVVATVAAAKYRTDDELLAALAARVGTEDPPLAVVLDGVEDPRNLGAIIRTVECAGAHAVFVPERRAAGLTETAAKAAAGALEYVPVARTVNVVRLLEELKGRGVWTVGTSAEAETDYTDWDWTQPCALLLGGEGEGLRRLVRERCDVLVRIPLRGHIESLNVSVAAAVILYEAVRQRTAARGPAYKAAVASGGGEE